MGPAKLRYSMNRLLSGSPGTRGRSVARVEVVNQTGEIKAVEEHIMKLTEKLSSSRGRPR
jgi:hypothetical protein